MLANFCENTSASFQKFDNNVTALSENWFKTLLGMKSNCSYPMTRKKMRYVWQNEGLSTINEIFHLRSIQKSEQLNNFFDLEHLMLTLEVAIKKFLHDLTKSPLLDEDLRFMNKLTEVQQSFPSIEIPDILNIIQNNKDQMFDKDLYDSLSRKLT